MAKFNDVKNKDTIFICDNCKKEILSKDIITIEPSDNISISMNPSPFLYIDKDDMIVGGSEQPSKKKGDKILACPHCNYPHLFGFDKKKE